MCYQTASRLLGQELVSVVKGRTDWSETEQQPSREFSAMAVSSHVRDSSNLALLGQKVSQRRSYLGYILKGN